MAFNIRQLICFVAGILCLFCFSWAQERIDLSSCGEAKGCFRSPADCTTFENCDFAVTWQATPDRTVITLELFARDSSRSVGWVALGLSQDMSMGSDSVTACTQDSSGAVQALQTYNNGKSGSPALSDPSFGLTLEEGHQSGTELLVCTVQRSAEAPTTGSPDDQTKFFNASQEYYLLLGYGAGNGGIDNQHYTRPIVSAEKIILTSTVADFGDDGESHTLAQVHGILMVVSWIFCITLSTFIARFFKNALGPKEIFNKKLWFVVHVVLNSICLILTLSSFIIIFVHVGGYMESNSNDSSSRKAHPVIGIIVTVLVIANPVMALFRPDPNAERRFIFNWAHWAVGKIAIVFAITNVFLGTLLFESEQFTESWVLVPLIIAVVFDVLANVTLEILQYWHKQSSSEKKQQHELTERTSSSVYDMSDGDPEKQWYQIFRVFLGIYIIVMLILTAAIIGAIA